MRENVDLHRFWLLMASAVVLVLLSSVSMAAAITVDNDGTGDYTTIQDAVNAADPEDTILVYPGTYSENVDVDKELNITSVGGASVTHVTAAASNDNGFHITADGVTINGFNMSGATDATGIRIESSNHSTIINNMLSNNYLGISLIYSDNNNLTINNASGNIYAGIYLLQSDNNDLNDNIVSNNTQHGIYLSSLGVVSRNNYFANNTVYNNLQGIFLQSPQDSTLTNNTVFNNTNNGITLDSSGDHFDTENNTLIGNTVLNNYNGVIIDDINYNNLIQNNVSNNTYKGIYLYYSHYNNLTENTVLENCVFGIYQNIGGLHLTTSNYNFIENNNISYNGDNGIYIGGYYGCGNNNLSGNILSDNGWYGITLKDSVNHCIYNNTISDNGNGGISLNGASEENRIYNNYFNNAIRNAYISGAPNNHWNTTNTTGPNIVDGPYIGGNYWATPDGTGFSQVNTDSNGDGFCDTPNDTYTIREGYEQYDCLPLASTVTDDEPPVVVPIAPLGKEVGPGETLELNVSVTDDSDIFSVVVNVSSVNDTVDTAFLKNVNGYWVNNSITLDVNPHGGYNLSINATDEFGNSNTSMKLSVIGESTSTGDGNEDDDGNPVYHPQPLFDVPTANPLLLVGVLGIAVMFFVRRGE